MLSSRNLASLVLASIAAVGVSARAQVPDRLPVFLTVKASDQFGQRLAYQTRELLRRSRSMALTAEDKQAWMWFDFVSVKGDDVSTAYSVVVLLNDANAFAGAAYWNNVVGFCGSDKIESCAQSIMAHIDQAVVDFQARYRQRQAQSAQPAQQPSDRKR